MEENFQYKFYLDEGINAFYEGKYDNSIEFLNKSIQIKNDFDISYFFRAACHQAKENWDEAMLDYTKAIQLNPKMTDAYYNRAKIILSRKDIINPKIENAIEDLKKAIELDDKFIDAMYAMAAGLKKLGKYEEAIEYLDKIIKIEPDAVNARALKKLILTKYTN